MEIRMAIQVKQYKSARKCDKKEKHCPRQLDLQVRQQKIKAVLITSGIEAEYIMSLVLTFERLY
jgi:uroporphyrinogen-III synthase